MSREDDVPFDEEETWTPAPLIAPDQRPCPECGSAMVEGWVPEQTSAGTFVATAWYPGPPRTTQGLFGGVIVLMPNQKEGIPVRAFRCVRCGFLKFYARAAG